MSNTNPFQRLILPRFFFPAAISTVVSPFFIALCLLKSYGQFINVGAITVLFSQLLVIIIMLWNQSSYLSDRDRYGKKQERFFHDYRDRTVTTSVILGLFHAIVYQNLFQVPVYSVTYFFVILVGIGGGFLQLFFTWWLYRKFWHE